MINQLFFTPWNFMRWLRLIFGVFVAFEAIRSHDALSGIIAAFFFFQVYSNTGCCGMNACEVPKSSSNKSTNDMV